MRYLSQLDTADLQDPSEALTLKKGRIKEKLEKLKSEMDKLAAIEKQVHAAPDQQIWLTDPDSRSMATSGRGSGVVGYNVQVAVDTEHHLIVAHKVTNVGNDTAHLSHIADQSKSALGVETLDAIADRGYFDGEEILACEQAGITVTLPKPQRSGAKSEGSFGKQDFVYLADENVYRCPAGEKLKYRFTARSMARNFTVIGPMPSKPAQSKLSARREESVASRAGSTRRLSRPCRKGSTKIRTPCACALRRSSIRSAQ